MTLFTYAPVMLRHGGPSDFKIDCDALTEEDLDCLAYLIIKRVQPFGEVLGVPRGGLRLAEALKDHTRRNTSRLLIVEDVCTTGKSMETFRAGRDAIGACIFQRGACPSWVTPLFVLTPEANA